MGYGNKLFVIKETEYVMDPLVVSLLIQTDIKR